MHIFAHLIFIYRGEEKHQALDKKHSKLILLFILSPDLSFNCITFIHERWKLCRVKKKLF